MRQAQTRTFWQAAVFAAAITLVASTAAFAAVSTDQPDYTPGSIVTISGDNSNAAGYQSGDAIHVDVSGPNGYASSCDATAGPDGTWSCQVTLADSLVAVGSYTYTATDTAAGFSESGTFTDAPNLKIIGINGGQHEITPSGRGNEEDLGSVVVGDLLSLDGTNCTTTPYDGVKVSADGIGNGLQAFSFGYGTPSGDTNNNAILSSKTTFTETAGLLFGSSDFECVGFDIATTGLTAGTTYHGTLGASGTGSPSANPGYYLFKFTVTSPTVTDTTAPVITFQQTPDGSNGWFKMAPATVTVTATDSDDGGVASLACKLDGTAVTLSNTGSTATTMYGDVSTSTDGDHTVSCQAADSTGNTAYYADNITHLKLDTVAPAITITTPSSGASYILNQVVYASYGCTDATSLVASCTGTVSDGSAIDTSTIGSHTFTVNAADNAGNTSTLTYTYTVKYNLCLLYDPLKSHKAGSTAPLKLYLCDANGVDVSSSSIIVNATSLVRKDSSASGILEDSGYANSPDNNFRYDGTLGPNGGYIFNLSTKSPSPALGQTKALATGTWVLNLTVDGAGGYSINFDVK